MSYLYVFLPHQASLTTDAELACDWFVVDESKTIVREGRSNLDQILSETELGEREDQPVQVFGVIPDEEILFVRIEIPGRNETKLRQAAPFAIEPYLSSDLADMHIAVWGLKSTAGTATVAIDREKLTFYADLLESTGGFVAGITAISQLQPVPSSTINAWLYDDQLTVQTSTQMASLNAGIVSPTLSSLISSIEGDEAIEVTLVKDIVEHPIIDELSEMPRLAISSQASSKASYLATHHDRKTSLNLLQGEFEPEKDWSKSLKRWQQSLAVVLVLGLVASFVFSLEGFWAQRESDRLRTASVELFESKFGTYNGFDNPAYLLQKRAPGLAGGDTFSHLLTLIAKHFESIELNELRYNAVNKSMTLEIVSVDFSNQEQFKDALEAENLRVEFTSVEQRSDRYHTAVSVVYP